MGELEESDETDYDYAGKRAMRAEVCEEEEAIGQLREDVNERGG